MTRGISPEAPGLLLTGFQCGAWLFHVAAARLCWSAALHSRTHVGVSSAAMVLFPQACSSPLVPREAEGPGAARPGVKPTHHTEFADESQTAHKGRCLGLL